MRIVRFYVRHSAYVRRSANDSLAPWAEFKIEPNALQSKLKPLTVLPLEKSANTTQEKLDTHKDIFFRILYIKIFALFIYI